MRRYWILAFLFFVTFGPQANSGQRDLCHGAPWKHDPCLEWYPKSSEDPPLQSQMRMACSATYEFFHAYLCKQEENLKKPIYGLSEIAALRFGDFYETLRVYKDWSLEPLPSNWVERDYQSRNSDPSIVAPFLDAIHANINLIAATPFAQSFNSKALNCKPKLLLNWYGSEISPDILSQCQESKNETPWILEKTDEDRKYDAEEANEETDPRDVFERLNSRSCLLMNEKPRNVRRKYYLMLSQLPQNKMRRVQSFTDSESNSTYLVYNPSESLAGFLKDEPSWGDSREKILEHRRRHFIPFWTNLLQRLIHETLGISADKKLDDRMISAKVPVSLDLYFALAEARALKVEEWTFSYFPKSAEKNFEIKDKLQYRPLGWKEKTCQQQVQELATSLREFDLAFLHRYEMMHRDHEGQCKFFKTYRSWASQVFAIGKLNNPSWDLLVDKRNYPKELYEQLSPRQKKLLEPFGDWKLLTRERGLVDKGLSLCEELITPVLDGNSSGRIRVGPRGPTKTGNGG